MKLKKEKNNRNIENNIYIKYNKILKSSYIYFKVFFISIIIIYLLFTYIIKQNKAERNRGIKSKKNMFHKTVIQEEEKQNLNEKFKKDILFLKNCINDENLESFINYENPKLSIVIPLYNNGKYLKRLMRSIQGQQIKEIEIIFIDDCSTDNGTKILKEFSKIDKRIRIVKNEENKDALYTYSKCLLEAKANHVMILDSDDMLLSNLKQLYEITFENNKDINDFGYIYGKLNNFNEVKMLDRELYQPDIGEMIFTGKYVGCAYITKKIYKSEIVKYSIKTLKKKYLNYHMNLNADTLLFICIFHYANSYKSFNNLYSQIYMDNGFSTSRNIEANYNKLFDSNLHLLQYVNELKYNSKEVYNSHISFGLWQLDWAIRLCGNRKLEVIWDKLNDVIIGILINNDLNENHKKEINYLLGIIKQKNKTK